MSITSAKSGATGISLALENNFMEPIASTLVGSGGSGAIEFNDIPQTYKHLQIRIIGRDNRSGVSVNTSYLNINGDKGTNYSYHAVYGSGTSALATGLASNTFGVNHQSTAGSATASAFAATVIDILDYSNTSKNKTIRSLSGYDDNSTGRIALWSSLWMSTNPVTSITFAPAVDASYQQYSRFSLYGIRG